MLAILGILLLFFSWGVFQWSLRRGEFRRYPYEQFVLVGASFLIGLLSVLERASVLHVALFVVEAAALGTLTWYMSVGARFRRANIALSVGEPFPAFALTDSHGDIVESASLQGKTALYLFYRGPW